ncbi:MAG: hypothetical protein ACYTG4_16145, partial [Planctomycetota bacterium]
RSDACIMVIPLPEAPWDHRDACMTEYMRPEGDDFASALPGAELDTLYSFESPGEVLKLLARLFAYLDEVPGASAAGRSVDADAVPQPSQLAHNRVELRG